MNNHLRLPLTAALALLLLACTVAAWAIPGGRHAGTATSPATARSGSCGMVVGPAHSYCTRHRSTTSAAGGQLATHAHAPALRDGHIALAFATAAIGGATGLILNLERRTR